MRFMLQYPDLNGLDNDLLDAGSITDVAVATERAGFAGMSFTEHPVPGARWLAAGGHQTLDPFVALTAAAKAAFRSLRVYRFTEDGRIRVGIEKIGRGLGIVDVVR